MSTRSSPFLVALRKATAGLPAGESLPHEVSQHLAAQLFLEAFDRPGPAGTDIPSQCRSRLHAHRTQMAENNPQGNFISRAIADLYCVQLLNALQAANDPAADRLGEVLWQISGQISTLGEPHPDLIG